MDGKLKTISSSPLQFIMRKLWIAEQCFSFPTSGNMAGKGRENNDDTYQCLHHIPSSLPECRHLTKYVDRIDDPFLEFIKDNINSKEYASPAYTSTEKIILIKHES